MAIAVSVAVALPVIVVALAGTAPDVAAWRHLWRTSLPEMLTTTTLLVIGTAAGSLAVGTALGWLVTMHRFPGRRGLEWLLLAPLAVPGYVLAFVYLSIFGYTGPVQGALRSWFGVDVWVPDIRSTWGAALVLTLTLYPYVYLLARAAFLEQGAATFDAGRALGHSRRTVWWRVVLPLARPSLAAGVALVMMETLTDIGTVQQFGVPTVSVGIYRAWKGAGDRATASELALFVLVLALVVLAVERALRGGARFHQRGGRSTRIESVTLRGWRAWGATAACSAVVGAGFVAPMVQLLAWSESAAFDRQLVDAISNTLWIAALAALACVGLALVIANARRLGSGRLVAFASRVTMSGYAVPGPVVGIGVLAIFLGPANMLDADWAARLVTVSTAGLVYAYVVRFMAPAYNSVDASLEKITPTMTMSARTLGASPWRVLRRVHLPLARTGIVTGLVLVAVDAIKELPIVLLLRPFGFSTLSVRVFELAGESRWEAVGVPALVLVTVSLAAVAVLLRASRAGEATPERPVVPEAWTRPTSETAA